VDHSARPKIAANPVFDERINPKLKIFADIANLLIDRVGMIQCKPGARQGCGNVWRANQSPDRATMQKPEQPQQILSTGRPQHRATEPRR
jgi:hypothetical protein